MHNSLVIRKLLKEANANPLARERRDPHRGLMRDPLARPGVGDMVLEDSWSVRAEIPDKDAARLLSGDLLDFLRRMQIETGEESARSFVLSLSHELAPRAFRVACRAPAVRIEAGDIAGLWAGVSWTEREMAARRGPFLPLGDFSRSAAWGTQIHQGPWLGNASVPDFDPEYLDDESFRLFAHYGVNSMMIYGDMLCYAKSDILPELNHPDADKHLAVLKDAARRAARYGVRFSYLAVGPKLLANHPVFRAHPSVRGAAVKTRVSKKTIHFLCSSDETVLSFYEEFFARLCREVPELLTIMLIVYAESFYHCRIWDRRDTCIPCGICGSRDPHDVVAGQVSAVERGVRAAGRDSTVAVWIYSWDRGDRRNLFRVLPPNTAVFHHVEKDGFYQRDGYKKHAWDYSVDCIGPTPDMTALAEFAHLEKRQLFVKTETGIGLEVFQFPYVPAMQRLAERWRVVRGLEPDGVHQSWLFFGMFGSRAEEMGWWAAYEPNAPAEQYLMKMAARDFGPEAAETVFQAWERMSRAVQHIPCTCFAYYYIGPSFLGPAHPLMPDSGTAVPDVFQGYLFYLQEDEETFATKTIEEARFNLVLVELPERFESVVPDEPGADVWPIVIREYGLAASEAEGAWQLMLRANGLPRTSSDARRLKEETLLTELVYRTFLCCENTARFLAARRDFERTGQDSYRQEMRRVALVERANALAALPIYEEAPWLDISLRTDGRFSPCADMINEKIRMLDEFIKA